MPKPAVNDVNKTKNEEIRYNGDGWIKITVKNEEEAWRGRATTNGTEVERRHALASIPCQGQ